MGPSGSHMPESVAGLSRTSTVRRRYAGSRQLIENGARRRTPRPSNGLSTVQLRVESCGLSREVVAFGEVMSMSEVVCTRDLHVRGCVHRSVIFRRVRTRVHGRCRRPKSPAQMSGIVCLNGLPLRAFDRAVDGGTSHGEQFGQLRHARECFTYGPVTGYFTGQGIRDIPPGVTSFLPVSGGGVR